MTTTVMNAFVGKATLGTALDNNACRACAGVLAVGKYSETPIFGPLFSLSGVFQRRKTTDDSRTAPRGAGANRNSAVQARCRPKQMMRRTPGDRGSIDRGYRTVLWCGVWGCARPQSSLRAAA